MTTFLFANNVSSRLLLPVGLLDAALTLVDGGGDPFPDPQPYDYAYGYHDYNPMSVFAITLTDQSTGAQEICYCYAREGDTLFVARAREGTTAKAWPENTLVSMQLTAGILNWLRDRV